MESPTFQAVTVTLNPAVDCTVSIPRFTAGTVNRVKTAEYHPGGKGVNVASTLADLGHQTSVTGFLGRDNSAMFQDLFASKNIHDDFILLPGSTRTGIKIADAELDQTTDINFPGLSPSREKFRELMDRIETLNATWFVLSGSLPENVDATIYRQLITTIRARNIQVLLDTSAAPLCHALKAFPTAIKPNIHELSELVGSPLKTREEVFNAASELLEKGIKLVVVSMGEDGALFVTKEQTLTAKPPVIPVVSTVGAGDAMVAGLIAGSLRGFDLESLARFSTACSMDAISRIGPRKSSQNNIEQHIPNVIIS